MGFVKRLGVAGLFAGILSSPHRHTAVQAQSKTLLSDDTSPETLVMEPVFEDIGRPGAVRADKAGMLYVLVPRDNCIAVYTHGHKLLKRIGHRGSGPGEFSHPMDFKIDNGVDRLYVADQGNNRVQVLTLEGVFISQFEFPSPIAIDALSTGEVLVAGRPDEELVRVYSADGRALGSLGKVVETGVANRHLNGALNSTRVLVGEPDEIFVLFRGLLPPTLREYKADGTLVMELHPEGTKMADVISYARVRLTELIDSGGIGYTGVLNAVALDPENRDIWICPAAPVVYVYSKDGVKRGEYRLVDKSKRMYGLFDLYFTRDRKAYATTADGCFLFDLPARH